MKVNPVSWFGKARESKRRYRAVFGAGDGQEVLEELARGNFIFSQTTAVLPDGHVDAYRTAFNEGRRAVVLKIMEILNVPLDELHRMYEEQMKNREEE